MKTVNCLPLALLAPLALGGCADLLRTAGKALGGKDEKAAQKPAAAPAPTPAPKTEPAPDPVQETRRAILGAEREQRYFVAALARNPGAASAEKLEAAMGKLTSIAEGDGPTAAAASYFVDQLRRQRALLTSDDPATTLTSLYPGLTALETISLERNEPRQATMKVSAGTCYVGFTFARPGWLRVVSDGPREIVQRFGLIQRRTGSYRIGKPAPYAEGFCAVGDGSVRTVMVAQSRPDHRRRVAWLSAPRAKLPERLTADLAVRYEDRCNVDHWKSLWLDPIPGSLVYRDDAAGLVRQASFGSYMKGHSYSLFAPSGPAGRAAPRKLAARAPEAFAWKKNRIQPCKPREHKTSPASIALDACIASVKKRFRPRFDAARKALETGRSRLKRLQANDRIAALKEQQHAALAPCRAKEDAIQARLGAAIQEIRKHYESSKPTPAMDRIALDKKVVGWEALTPRE